jgi:hypothetical protein
MYSRIKKKAAQQKFVFDLPKYAHQKARQFALLTSILAGNGPVCRDLSIKALLAPPLTDAVS